MKFYRRFISCSTNSVVWLPNRKYTFRSFYASFPFHVNDKYSLLLTYILWRRRSGTTLKLKSLLLAYIMHTSSCILTVYLTSHPSEILVRSGILVSDWNNQPFYTIPHLDHPFDNAISELQLFPSPEQYSRTWSICLEVKSSYERHPLV